MGTRLNTGIFIVSVDLPASRADSNRLGKTIEPLVDLLCDLQIGATWGVPGAIGWKELKPLLGLATPQELAILADPAWMAASAGRERFCRELALHQAAAAQIGYRPTTLLANGGSLAPYADLAQKRGITATRPLRDLPAPSTGFSGWVGRLARISSHETGAYRPATPRFGLWDLKPSAIWPHPATPQSSLPVTCCRRGLEAAIALGGVYHLVLDALAVTQAGKRAIVRLRRLLTHAVGRRQQTRLVIVTMREAAARLSRPRAGGYSRSILQSRAA